MNNEQTTENYIFEGNGNFNREDEIILFNSKLTSADENGLVFDETNPTWTPIGDDNDELTRNTNNDIEAKKNVLGKMTIDATKGAEDMDIDPIAIKANDKLSYIAYMAYKYGLVGDKMQMQFCSVTLADKQGKNSYGAFTEHGIMDLTSWGGDTSKLNAPVKITFKNDKTHGTFNPTTKAFTPTTAE